jgi:hypothetical protein
MTDHERTIIQKFLALDMWLHRARDMMFFERNKEAKEAFERAEKCLKECEGLNESSYSSPMVHG